MIAKEDLQKAIEATSSMRAAAIFLRVDYQTLRKYAKTYGIFVPNQSGKGVPTRDWKNVPFEELTKCRKRIRVLTEAHYACEVCGFNQTRSDGKIVIQVDHIDGNHENWTRMNLRALCPNCHAIISEHFMFYGRKHSSHSRKKCGRQKRQMPT